MKKLLFVLACAASLGLWISCNNGEQELDVTLHSGVDTKEYNNAGKVTATKVTMVTKRGGKVTLNDKNEIVIPTDRDDYYIGTVQTLSEDGKKVSYEKYWFYNDWDDGEEITFDKAYVHWDDNVWYDGDGASAGKEDVSNKKTYKFSFGAHNDVVDVWHDVVIMKSGNVYQYDGSYYDYDDYYEEKREIFYDNLYGTAALDVSGNLEGDFTIGTLLKKLDFRYGKKKESPFYGKGSKYVRLDEQTKYVEDYSYVWDEEEGELEERFVGYKPEITPADTSVYYLTNVSFTKN